MTTSLPDDTPFIRTSHGGWKHPDRTYEEQTDIFVAAVQFLFEIAKQDFADLCEAIGRPVDKDNPPFVPPLENPADPDVMCAFEFGRLWQASQTTRSFAAQLGIEGYENDMVVDFIPPVPDDPSELYDEEDQ